MSQHLSKIAHLIDDGADTLNAESTGTAFAVLDQLQNDNPPPEASALIHYYRANAWANRCRERPDYDSWAWEQPEVQAQILELRRARGHAGFEKLHPLRRCQILTNLGNQLNSVGRFVDAIETWDSAFEIEPHFAMAHGNRGIGLEYYADSHFDRGQAGLQLVAAYDALKRTSGPNALFEGLDHAEARGTYEKRAKALSKRVPVDEIRRSVDVNGFSLGRSTKERAYRRWCLDNRLFLNALNDLGPLSIAAQDGLTLPGLTTTLDAKMPRVLGLFNQMKQEFASARYLYWEGLHEREAGGLHFSDRDVTLVNTLDYPVYGLAAEKMRMSYRVAYSLFDKSAYLLNHYLGLGVREDKVTFRNLWSGGARGANGQSAPVLARLANHENWPLRGLYWLSKDLYERGFQEAMLPEAKALADTRNYLEHKYLALRQSWAVPVEGSAPSEGLAVMALPDDLFADRALHVLKLVRSTFVYLSLAIHREERLRSHDKPEGIIAPMSLFTLEDRFKS